jgi:hypothetical protein
MKNEIGNRYGMLVVVESLYRRVNHQFMWWCVCDCGESKAIRGASLRNGETRSCGCLRGGNARLAYGESSKKLLYKSYKYCAKRRGYAWDLSPEEFFGLTQAPCNYCGVMPAQVYQPNRGSYGSFVYNGIDRVENEFGYVPTNVVPCCTICNVAKNKLTSEQFKDWIRRVYETSVA